MGLEGFADRFEKMQAGMALAIVGQEEIVRGVLVSAIAGGHVLIEGVPGLGKTLIARTFARVSGCTFKRIQFTPDLMPSDITGSSVFDRNKGDFTFVPGPVFANVVLADEINRAPAKTQSALLEAMQDHTVSEGGTSRALPAPFLVVATQNPVESQGTYPLPEAQLDRFLFKLRVEDPPKDVEETIVRKQSDGFDPSDLSSIAAVSSPAQLGEMQVAARGVKVDDKVIAYAVEIVRKTRQDRSIELGASPRASLSLVRAAQVVAASEGRDFVTPDDVKPMAAAVLRHRLMLHPDAQLQGTTPDDRIGDILKNVSVPK
jgi:MoxR-like ATPase